jgi:hypothetical protein
VLLTPIGAVGFFAVFPGFFDPFLGSLREQPETVESETGESLSPGPARCSPSRGWRRRSGAYSSTLSLAFGKEFGWRAYLKPNVLPLLERRTMVLTGIVWGVRRWPSIAVGHNCGLGYPAGRGSGCWRWPRSPSWLAQRSAGAPRGERVSERDRSGMISRIAGTGVLYLGGYPSTLLGPLPVGLVGSVGWQR